MKILLTGMTGFIGGHLHTALESEHHSVTGCSRSNGVDFNQMQTPEVWLSLVKGMDAVINAVGIISQTRRQSFDVLHNRAPTALFQACEQAKVKRLIKSLPWGWMSAHSPLIN